MHAQPPAQAPRGTARLPFEAHRTRLPTFFYLFSFCPAVPSPFTSPSAFARHPGVLYLVGFAAALLAGCGMPALDLLYGIYTNRVTPGAASPQDIRDASSYIGWVVTIVGVGEFLLAWLFLACFTTASHDLTQRLRHTYVASVLARTLPTLTSTAQERSQTAPPRTSPSSAPASAKSSPTLPGPAQRSSYPPSSDSSRRPESPASSLPSSRSP
ncbi:hypothetical protein L1887_55062 [Cichorium endivia]|nr:hypothetical protein L1887_55062 [Cichorium endivia]